MGLREAFVAEIDVFLTGHGMGPATFGRQALKDPNFVFELRRAGRCPNLRTIERVRAYMRTA